MACNETSEIVTYLMKCLLLEVGNETAETVTCLSWNVLLLQHVVRGLKLLRIAHKVSCFLSYLKFGIRLCCSVMLSPVLFYIFP